jgi:hypothetical protein
MKKIKNIILIGSILITSNFLHLPFCFFLSPDVLHAEVIDRIVAIVNDDVILQSEFLKAYNIARQNNPDVKKSEVLDGMIDRLLLLSRAKKFRPVSLAARQGQPRDDDTIIKEYIDVRLKGFIHIPYDDIEYYYTRHRDLFKGKEFFDVRDEIEKHLVEQELNVKLREFINELKSSSYIRIQLKDDP